jgi:hypothetical protein
MLPLERLHESCVIGLILPERINGPDRKIPAVAETELGNPMRAGNSPLLPVQTLASLSGTDIDNRNIKVRQGSRISRLFPGRHQRKWVQDQGMAAAISAGE